MGARSRQGSFRGTVRPLPRRARRQAAQDWRRTTRGDVIHFELVEGQEFRRKSNRQKLNVLGTVASPHALVGLVNVRNTMLRLEPDVPDRARRETRKC